MRKWKSRLSSHGLLLAEGAERLTNSRYADDLLLFGNSLEEVTDMMEKLVSELCVAGLSVNGAKTKIITTDNAAACSNVPLYVDVAGCMVEVLQQQATHKYLGRLFSGDLTKRGETNLCHRLQCGWMKYSQLRQTLQNKNIPIRLRFKLFDATVTPTVLYSLSSTPLTSGQVGRLDACQRKMMRKIVGWTRLNDEDWSVTGSRMKAKLEAAMQLHPV